MQVFHSLESEVRSYSRCFPTVFKKAKESYLFNEEGKRYIDFFSGAGALNYGHNNERIKQAIVQYIQDDGILHSLDKATTAKRHFLEQLSSLIFEPRGLQYKVQFTGPTGTNAIEAALKLARLVKGRSNIIAFTNAFHGMTLGSLALTSNDLTRNRPYMNRSNVTIMPYDGYLGVGIDTSFYLRRYLEDNHSGVDLPAAVILETVQAEGGIHIANDQWLRDIEQVCRDFDLLLIIDDIQVGNGRTGTFFSFENSGICPDIVTLGKSIGGGLPLSLVLIKPEIDQWKPGEHSGTFRGNNLAFVAGAEALLYWTDDTLSKAVTNKSVLIADKLQSFQKHYESAELQLRGKGLIFGLEFSMKGLVPQIAKKAFDEGLIIEVIGAKKNVLKFLPPLTIEEDTLQAGLDIIDKAIHSTIS
ncbi:MAG: diaminobutyrate--2-oxoglutarate transaminase [Nitrospirales bacterium]